jgi:hypothetical protein
MGVYMDNDLVDRLITEINCTDVNIEELRQLVSALRARRGAIIPTLPAKPKTTRKAKLDISGLDDLEIE